MDSPGNWMSGSRVNAAGMAGSALTTAREKRVSSLARASSVAATIRSNASIRSASPAGIRTAWMLSWRSLMRMWLTGAELLRQAGLIQHRHPFAFDVCRHAQQRTDGHHPGATHTGEKNAVGVIARDRRWLGQGREVDIGTDTSRFLQSAALDRDKAGAETAHAGEVLVAAGLVDGALAAGVGFLGQDRQAVGLDAAVAAALAYVGVNHHPLVGVGHGAALTATTFFGGAGLIVDDYRAAFDLPQFPLNRVQVVAVVEGGAVGKVRPGRVLVDVVTDHGDSANTLAVKLVTDLLHSECAVHRLAAGHRHRVVVEDLVGDVGAGGNGDANGQHAGMEIGAIAEILEHVLLAGKGRLAQPGHAFAAHLGEGVGAPFHPGGHVMAANATQGTTAFGHLSGGVMGAARAEVRGALEALPRIGEAVFFLGQEVQIGRAHV